MNLVIAGMATDPNVTVINVHDEFMANPGAELFDPFGSGYMDPHPTSYGHLLIYNLLITP